MSKKSYVIGLFFVIVLSIFFANNSIGIEKIVLIDNFKGDVDNQYTRLHSPKVVLHGYGIYFDKADVKLSIISVDGSESALRIDYELPPLYGWGNWLSIRREFDSLRNLKEYKGIKLNVMVEKPSQATLRVTLADVINHKRRAQDELWWFDFSSNVLSKKPGKWQAFALPFRDFYESYGAGTRHNDSILDLSKIAAYELNVVSKGLVREKGSILIRSIETY